MTSGGATGSGVNAIVPVPLENAWIALEPLGPHHVDGLEAAATDAGEIFRWMHTWQPREDGLGPIVAKLADDAARGVSLTWAIRRKADSRIVGSTSYLDISTRDRHVEVGSTWIGSHWWRTEVNTATKLLVLGHAFDTLGLERVALKTDHLNVRSQRAIERLGALREGVLRHHKLRPDGSWRDTVYYSILAGEWPSVRDRLAKALADR